MAEDLGRSLEQLTATIQEQNKELKRKDSLDELDKSITALEKSGTENSAQLRQTLANIQIALDSASNAEQMELAEEQLEALKDLAGTEEENREAAKRQEEANEFLSKIVSGIDGLADAYDKQLDALKPSAGLVAGLGAAALLFMDPETLFAGVQAAIDGVFAIVDSIKMFLEGDFTGGFELLKENIGAVGAIVGTFAVLFGGTIIRTIGSMVKAFSGLTKVLGRLFLPFTIITGLISFVTGFVKGYEEGGVLGGIEAGLKSAFDTLIAWPLDLIKDGVAFVLGKLGFKNAEATLNEFSFSEQIDKIITAIFDMVEGAIDWVKTLFTDPVAALQSLWDGLVSGANWLVDIVYAPINAAINWVKELFTNPVAALESLAMGLIGPDGILGVVTAPIDKAINWVMGLFNLGDPDRDFSLYDVLYTPIDKTITWLQGLFTDPVAALQQAWNGLVGEGGLIDIIYAPIDKAIAWIQGLFGWGNPEEPFKLSTLVKDAFKAAKEWVVGLFTWGSEAGAGEDGSWTLSTFVSNAFTDVKNWVVDKLTFGADLAVEGWTNLKDFVSTKFTAVKEWFTGLFSWASDGLSEGWTNLTDFVKGKWTATKEWFTGMFTWSSDENEKGVIQELFDSTIEKIKTFFTDLFDFLPSIEEIKALMTSLLPDWMKPDSVQEQRDSIQAEIASQQAEMADGDMRNWRGKLRSEIIEELQAELASLPQLNYGGIVSAPKSGTPVMLHGEEIVAPLNSPQGQVLMAINDLMNSKAAAGAGEYGGMGGPMIVQGGSSSSNNTNNVSTSNYTIQQGITPDDFLKRDFLNFSY